MTTVATDLKTILKLEVPLIVQVGSRRVTLDDVLALAPGAILELDKSADAPLDLLINNKPIGTGTALKVGENFGVQVSAIGTPSDRVTALGS